MKKALLLLLLSANYCMAGGFYYGGGFGYSLVDSDYESAFSKPDVVSYMPFFGNIGYRHDFNKWYVAAELEGWYLNKVTYRETGYDGDDEEESEKITHKRGEYEYSFSGHMVLGAQYNDFLEFFGRVGAGKVKYRISATNGVSINEQDRKPPDFSKDGMLNAIHYGAGFNYDLDTEKNIKIVVEYRGMKLSSFDFPEYGKTKTNIHALTIGFQNKF